MVQARSAPGNISAEQRMIDGVHHTLSVWKDRRSMLDYMRSGDHIKVRRISCGRFKEKILMLMPGSSSYFDPHQLFVFCAIGNEDL